MFYFDEQACPTGVRGTLTKITQFYLQNKAAFFNDHQNEFQSGQFGS